jgi:hypothetical protein
MPVLPPVHPLFLQIDRQQDADEGECAERDKA